MTARPKLNPRREPAHVISGPAHWDEPGMTKRGPPPPYSAAICTSGAAARTSASTWLSNFTKFSWNLATS
jgi:hypothetical protein